MTKSDAEVVGEPDGRKRRRRAPVFDREKSGDVSGTKLTASQKRGKTIGPIRGVYIDPVSQLVVLAASDAARSRFTSEQLRTAQVNVAALALEHPDLASEYSLETGSDQRVWLREVLEVLGLRRDVLDVKPITDDCDDAGTERGYNRHLGGYTYPCGACRAWRDVNVTVEAMVERRRTCGDGGKSSMRMR